MHVEVGEITGAYGVAGAVWVRPLTDTPHRARSLREVTLVRAAESAPAQVRAVREVEGRWIVELQGVETRTDAEGLRGWRLAVPRAARPALPPGRMYVSDLVGRAVVAEDGEPLGTLADIFPTGGNDVFVIRGPQGELLFPALKDLILACPGTDGAIRVRVPSGLREACLTRGG